MARKRRKQRRKQRRARGLLWTLVLAVGVALVAHRLARSEAKRSDASSPPDVPHGSTSGEPGADPACRGLVEEGRRRRVPGRLRIGTWNVRWFPDGRPGSPKAGKGPRATEIDELACQIAGLGVHVLAMQEIKQTERARRALRRLRARLDALAGGSWRVEVDGCEGKGRQHVALLYDAAYLRLSHRRDVAEINPHGDGACTHMMRPGLAAYFERPGGADFHLIVVHLKSGGKRAEIDARARSLAAIAAAHAGAQRATPDADVVIAGDFNTMGCPHCRPKITSGDELRGVDARLGALVPPFRRILADLPCSEFHRGHGTLLDHFVVASGMAEVPRATTAEVGGLCAERACRSWAQSAEPPRAYLELSDHCPVVLEIEDSDRD